MEGVKYEIACVSFMRRIELARRIRDAGRILHCGVTSEAREKLEATVLQAEIDLIYLEWGLLSIGGLEIDGVPATPKSVIDLGPVTLAVEILARIKAECGVEPGALIIVEAESRNVEEHTDPLRPKH
jgi:hypothetical protein